MVPQGCTEAAFAPEETTSKPPGPRRPACPAVRVGAVAAVGARPGCKGPPVGPTPLGRARVSGAAPLALVSKTSPATGQGSGAASREQLHHSWGRQRVGKAPLPRTESVRGRGPTGLEPSEPGSLRDRETHAPEPPAGHVASAGARGRGPGANPQTQSSWPRGGGGGCHVHRNPETSPPPGDRGHRSCPLGDGPGCKQRGGHPDASPCRKGPWTTRAGSSRTSSPCPSSIRRRRSWGLPRSTTGRTGSPSMSRMRSSWR